MKPYVYIDVDLTLVDLETGLYPGVRDKLRQLALHYTLIAWSAGGRDYAEEVLKRNDVVHLFTFVLSKPFIVIDDDVEHLLRSCRQVKIDNPRTWANLWSLIFGKDVSPYER